MSKKKHAISMLKKGIKTPKVQLLHYTPIAVAELAARTAYDSIELSNNSELLNDISMGNLDNINNIKYDPLLGQLAHVYHHESVLEHINISLLVSDVSRGVLQEHVRHRIASIIAKSTRYTMANLVYAMVYFYHNIEDKELRIRMFTGFIISLDMFIFKDKNESFKLAEYIASGMINIFRNKLNEDYSLLLSSEASNIDAIEDYTVDEFIMLKKKKNIGDYFKQLVTDAWSTRFVWTINLRSLSNYMKLRNSNAAYFEIETLAKEIDKVLPKEISELLFK